MGVCCVVGCSNRTSRKTGHQIEKEKKNRLSFHKFPENKNLRQTWIDAIRRKDWVPDQTSIVCSKHFDKNCFDSSPFYTKLLKAAVPTIFPIQYNCTPDQPEQIIAITAEPSLTEFSPPKEEPSTSNISISKEVRLLVNKTTSISPDHRRTRPFSPSRSTLIRNYKFKLSVYKKKIRSLQQKTRRQTNRIAYLQTVLRTLKSKKLIIKEIEL